jgi:hypothetical protein
MALLGIIAFAVVAVSVLAGSEMYIIALCAEIQGVMRNDQARRYYRLCCQLPLTMSTQATRRNERDIRVDKTPGVDASWEDST